MTSAKDSPFNNKGTRLHDIPPSTDHLTFMSQGWAPSPLEGITAHAAVPFTKKRRTKLSKAYKGVRLVIPAGNLKVRSNDSDYQFRAHSAFAWFTGISADDVVPDSVLVLEPSKSGHDALLFIHPRSPRDEDEFFRNSRHGEFWVGRRMTKEETEKRYGIKVRHIDTLPAFLKGKKKVLVVRGEDKIVDAIVKTTRVQDKDFLTHLSEMRLVKDEFEISEMKKAIATTARGFDDMLKVFPEAIKSPKGERVIEGAFFSRARVEGNDIGYPSIVASGSHACILHWIRNDGQVKKGDLILIDAGAETDAYYTADITRTVPINGKFSKEQRRIYEIVLEAADAGIKAVKPGADFGDFHKAAMRVVAYGMAELGVLPLPPEESLKATSGLHRRWMPHSTGHMLGIDVHDCAQARRENYTLAKLEPGMILTVEPGIYIHPDDEFVPPEYRGIGVRIEDDILVTKDGNINLSAGIPRTPDAIEKWVKKLAR
ncbi:MAG: aminopeptidase P family protein [Actinomycetes bacterium]